MRIVRTTQPAVSEPSLTKVKEYLNINFTESDTVIKIMLEQAIQLVESHTGFLFRSATYSQYFDYNEISNIMPLIYRPVSTVGYVRTYNLDNNATTVDTSTYYVETKGNRLYFEELPSENYRPIDAMEISYTLNPDLNQIPADLQMAVYDLVAYNMDNRGVSDKKIPPYIVSIINSYKDDMAVIGKDAGFNEAFNIGNRYYMNVRV